MSEPEKVPTIEEREAEAKSLIVKTLNWYIVILSVAIIVLIIQLGLYTIQLQVYAKETINRLPIIKPNYIEYDKERYQTPFDSIRNSIDPLRGK